MHTFAHYGHKRIKVEVSDGRTNEVELSVTAEGESVNLDLSNAQLDQFEEAIRAYREKKNAACVGAQTAGTAGER